MKHRITTLAVVASLTAACAACETSDSLPLDGEELPMDEPAQPGDEAQPGGEAQPGDVPPPADGRRRTPAEWERQASVWIQWPQDYEAPGTEEAFARVVEVIAEYQPVNLVATDSYTRRTGRAALRGRVGDNVTWHVIANDNSWMRDNGPRYVEVDGELVLQNWHFDAWGGGFGEEVGYEMDDAVPGAVARILDLPLEQVDLVHERGDLEVNGVDTAMVNWSVISHRNPELTRDEITARLQRALGVTSVIYAEGFDRFDGTRGHIDGMARFIDANTVVVGDDGGPLFDNIARQIAEQRPDLIIERLPLFDWSPAMNWLVGNGFVLLGSSGDPDEDDRVAGFVERYFPGRDVRFVDIDVLWENGGGIHCITNDEPARRR